MASEILLRAAQEQGAGRLARARELLEWVIKTFRDTPFANEAAQRLTVLTQEEAAQREKQAAGLLKQAISLEAQGKVDESRKMVRDIVALYEGTASSREARRRWQSQQQDDAAEVLRNTAAVDREQVATLLQRAAQEQTAGHLSQARGLLEWVVTTYRDTSFAEEAHNRLHDLTIAERNQHEKQADEILKKAISLQDSGKLEEARPLFYDLLTLYKGTPASAEAKRRQQQGLEIELNSEPVKALRDATALQRAGELAEAYTRLTAVVTRYPGTESAREAERRLREMKTANAQQISAVLQRAAQELAAGRPEKGRQLLEWVSAMYKGTSHGDEAYRQLQTLAKAERAKRDGEAATTLKQAISLQDQGKLSEALVLFHRILTEYATTPAGPEALRRQKEVEGILTRREATEQLRQALELDEAGQRSEARWLLEDTVRKYRNTPAALEAARRLERMGQTTGN
jgi:TolA-binding protein